MEVKHGSRKRSVSISDTVGILGEDSNPRPHKLASLSKPTAAPAFANPDPLGSLDNLPAVSPARRRAYSDGQLDFPLSPAGKAAAAASSDLFFLAAASEAYSPKRLTAADDAPGSASRRPRAATFSLWELSAHPKFVKTPMQTLTKIAAITDVEVMAAALLSDIEGSFPRKPASASAAPPGPLGTTTAAAVSAAASAVKAPASSAPAAGSGHPPMAHNAHIASVPTGRASPLSPLHGMPFYQPLGPASGLSRPCPRPPGAGSGTRDGIAAQRIAPASSSSSSSSSSSASSSSSSSTSSLATAAGGEGRGGDAGAAVAPKSAHAASHDPFSLLVQQAAQEGAQRGTGPVGDWRALAASFVSRSSSGGGSGGARGMGSLLPLPPMPTSNAGVVGMGRPRAHSLPMSGFAYDYGPYDEDEDEDDEDEEEEEDWNARGTKRGRDRSGSIGSIGSTGSGRSRASSRPSSRNNSLHNLHATASAANLTNAASQRPAQQRARAGSSGGERDRPERASRLRPPRYGYHDDDPLPPREKPPPPATSATSHLGSTSTPGLLPRAAGQRRQRAETFACDGRHSFSSLASRTQKASVLGVQLIGAYTPEERARRIERFREKRKLRVWSKRVKYDVRKSFADSRVRVKGRFVRKGDEPPV